MVDFKFDPKPFAFDLLIGFIMPCLFVGIAKNMVSKYDAWIAAAIVCGCVKLGLLFLFKFVYSIINQAPSSMRNAILSVIKPENLNIQRAKLLIKTLLALLLASINSPAFAFIGAYVTVGCLIGAVLNPKLDKLVTGGSED